MNGASESGAAAGRGHLPRHIQLTPGEEVLLTLRPWILIVWWKHVLTLGLYEFWRSRHVLALTSKRAVATQGFIVSKFDRFVPLERFQDATRERTWFWAYVRVSTAGGELGDKTKSSELRWGPYSPPAARRFVEHVNQLAYDARQEFAKPQIAAPTPDLPSAPVAPTSKNAADALRELASLRETGIVNDAEYEAKKAELLGRL